jgi:putative transposase
MRAWLRAYAAKHPCHGFRRAWAALRYDEGRVVNKKKIHRLWREEGRQAKTRSPRKRPGLSSVPPIGADAPNVVWAIDLQVRLHHQRQGHQDCLDDRRTHP